MNTYTSFDYLCNEPYFIDGIGTVVCPTLKDIRHITYNVFSIYLNIISMSLEKFLKAYGLFNNFKDSLAELSLFNLLLYHNRELLLEMLQFFFIDNTYFNEYDYQIDVYELKGSTKQLVGHINNNNFEYFREEIRSILGITEKENKELIFKNNLAKKVFNKLNKHSQELNQKKDENYTLDNMIKKYCTHNKVGINILNIWDMTYHQFIWMFKEYSNARQCDFNDMMAANSFQFKKASDYNPLDYISKLNIN